MSVTHEGAGARVLEWRRYVAAPGKAQALLERFDRDTFPLFAEYGIRVLAFGQKVDDPHELHYVCDWDSEQQMKETWKRWVADERWQKLKAASEADGPLVLAYESTLLTPPPSGPTFP
jgi:hypothetical protein